MIKSRQDLAALMDQTLLKPTAGYQCASAWLEMSVQENFAALCVSPFLVPVTTQRLAGSVIRVCSVCGFPFGFTNTESKVEEAAHLVRLGCHDVDMVMNVAAFLEGDDSFVGDDIAAVVRRVAECSDGNGIVKVIIETGYLESSDIERACYLAAGAGAHFVKTSSGFGPRGATVEDVRIMHKAVGGTIGVKAAGGIRDFDTAVALLEAGATRLGTSSGIEILDAFSFRQS